jgi:hypothetical protein
MLKFCGIISAAYPVFKHYTPTRTLPHTRLSVQYGMSLAVMLVVLLFIRLIYDHLFLNESPSHTLTYKLVLDLNNPQTLEKKSMFCFQNLRSPQDYTHTYIYVLYVYVLCECVCVCVCVCVGNNRNSKTESYRMFLFARYILA